MVKYLLSITLYFTNPDGRDVALTKFDLNKLYTTEEDCKTSGKEWQKDHLEKSEIKCRLVEASHWSK